MSSPVISVSHLSKTYGNVEGIWDGGGWAGNGDHALGLVALGALFTLFSSKVFRWE